MLRYYRLRAYNSRAAGRRPLNPYAAGRPTSRAIQWYTGLLVCNHCVVSYAPITVISPLIWDDQVALGVPSYIQNQPSGHMGLDMSSHYPPGAPLYSQIGLLPLCYELCADNGHLSPVWVYQAGPVALGVPPHSQISRQLGFY